MVMSLPVYSDAISGYTESSFYLVNRLAELNKVWHMGVFEGAFKHGDVTSGVR